MSALSISRLQTYRAETYHLHPHLRLQTSEQAEDFVNQRGFIHFWPIKGVELPSLWAAVAGERPVADAHDDPGHITWGWKDANLGARRWYYAKVIRKKATLISWALAPAFYALSENYGAPDEDYLIQYQEGHLTQEARLIFEALLDHGPLDTPELRRRTHLTSRKSNSPFERGLAQLQADFKILPVGISDSGAWHYAFIYDLVHRHYPQLPEQARPIRQRVARIEICRRYLQAVGAASLKDVSRLFGWRKSDAQRALDTLVTEGLLQAGVEITGLSDPYYVLPELL
ncbi:MAG: winged helix DNA-binding domain-containing protein [Anaerolineales bacterium]|nr:winged helix DNA-binding domain-containing protein [Anaerolineales bacterium]